MKVLLFNEKEETTEKLSKFFTEKGFSIHSSNDPMKGLNLIRQVKFDIILLDVNMQVAKGFGIIELLASDDILKNQNIFIFSEEDVPEIQVKNFLRRDGINGFLKKHTDAEELLSVINC
jgi:DNA-binding response OmpR family regulator